jgi:hypothetical protein
MSLRKKYKEINFWKYYPKNNDDRKNISKIRVRISNKLKKNYKNFQKNTLMVTESMVMEDIITIKSFLEKLLKE